MTYLNLKHLASSLVLIGSLAAFGFASAHDPAEAPKAQAAAADAPTQIPATVEGIWQAIDAKTADLQRTIQSGKLADVHHLAFAVRDLAAALPDKSKALTADQQAKVQSNVKFVATLADRLDASGDANDKTATQDNYDKLKKVLDGLRANYK